MTGLDPSHIVTLSRVEGIVTLSRVEGIVTLSRVEGSCFDKLSMTMVYTHIVSLGAHFVTLSRVEGSKGLSP